MRRLESTTTYLCLFTVMLAVTSLFGESVFHSVLILGVFFGGAALGERLERRVMGSSRDLALAATVGFAPAAVIYAASVSLHFRTKYLGFLHSHFSDDASIWMVLKSGLPALWKAVVTSAVPTLIVTFFFVVLLGALSGAKREGRAGALVAAFLFAFVLQPFLSLFQIAFSSGAVATGVAVYRWRKPLGAVLAVAFVAAFALSSRFEAVAERNIFSEGPDTRVLSRAGPVTLLATNEGRERTLYRGHYLEVTYRGDSPVGVDNYHAVLVHPPLDMHPNPESVLILGGGDGFIATEVVKHATVKSVVQVDEGAVLRFAKTNPEMRLMTKDALAKVTLVAGDPFDYVRAEGSYDVIIKAFPTAPDESLARSVSVEAFRAMKARLKPGGILSVHSDYYGTPSFWTIVRSVRDAGFTHIATLNDNFSQPDTLEGIIYASMAPFAFEKLKGPLVDTGVLPPVEGMKHDSMPEFIDYQIARSGRENRLFALSYLKSRREENGSFLPLVFPIGVY